MQTFEEVLAAAFQDELVKIAQEKRAGAVAEAAKKLKPGHKFIAGTAVGAVGYESLRRANQDRRMGRMVRIQQGGQGY